MRHLLILALFVLVFGIAIGLLTGRAIWRIEVVPSDRQARLIADSVRTSIIIADRDTIIAHYEREVQLLNETISKRPRTQTRVIHANTALRSAAADSLMRILDRPLSER